MVRSFFQFRRLNFGVMEWVSNKLKGIYKCLAGREQTSNPKNPKKLPISAKKMYMDHAKHRIIRKRAACFTKKANKKISRYLDSKLNRDMIDELSCPICLELIACPTSTPCGHTYCYKCLQQNLILHTTCAVCRTPLRQVTQLAVCEIMSNIINQKLKNMLSDDSLQSYNIRYADNKEYIQKRTVDPNKLNVGDQIDVRDTEYIWCKATVKQILKRRKNGIQTFQVLVHYHGWNRVYDQIIDVRSKRLAQYRTFTERTQLPHYNLPQGNDSHLRGVVIQGPAPRQELQIEERQPEQENGRRIANNGRQGDIFDFLFIENRDFDEEQQNNDRDENPPNFMDFIRRRRRLNQAQHEYQNQNQEVIPQRRFEIQLDPYLIDLQRDEEPQMRIRDSFIDQQSDEVIPMRIDEENALRMSDSQSQVSELPLSQDIVLSGRQLNRLQVEELINHSHLDEGQNLEVEHPVIQINQRDVGNQNALALHPIVIESDDDSDYVPQQQGVIEWNQQLVPMGEQGDQDSAESVQEWSEYPPGHS